MNTDTETATSRLAPVLAAAARAALADPVKTRTPVQIPLTIHVARAFPRDPGAKRRQMLAACERLELAEEAFYEYTGADGAVQRLTVVAACEIAQIWGNLDIGTHVVGRDDVLGESDVQAYAWDLETNTQVTQQFTAPHVRETRRGAYRVTDARDIHGVTADQGARRMRSCIIRVLPHWYVAAAEQALMATLMRSVSIGDEPLDKTVRTQTAAFMKAWDVTRAQLERKVGRPLERWTARDLVNLRILSKSLARGEQRVEAVFEARRVTADELPEAPADADRFHGTPDDLEHDGHPEDEYSPDCPRCRAQPAEADRQADQE